MAISITRYVDISSIVGGGNVVEAREFFVRVFTSNPLLPPQTIIQFTSAVEVGSYFGQTSEEYFRAVSNFTYVNKEGLSPQAIQYARWVSVACAPLIYPVQNNASLLATWTPISSGSFILTLGGHTGTLSGLDFSGAGSLAAVATIVQDAINAITAGGTIWEDATVVYSSSYGGFILTGGATDVVTNPVVVTAGGGGTDITPQGLLGWIPEQQVINENLIPGAIWASGSAAETISTTLTNSIAASNNFGSFEFLYSLNLTQSEVVSAATTNLSYGVMFLYNQAVTPANATAWEEAVDDIGGTQLTLTSPTFNLFGSLTNTSPNITNLPSTANLSAGQYLSGANIPVGAYITAILSATSVSMSVVASSTANEFITFQLIQYPEQLAGELFASTDYSGLSTVQNYMFQQRTNLSPSVSTDASANSYDSLSINYYGVTQQAGAQIAFYQRGVMQGLPTNILDIGAYTNEIWLRDAMTVNIMNLLLTVNQLPANLSGRAMLSTTIQAVIQQALDNGTISVGKALNTTQIAYITSVTKDANAWSQVQNSGYWLAVKITPQATSPVTYLASYILIYSKDDVIRQVVGQDILI